MPVCRGDARRRCAAASARAAGRCVSASASNQSFTRAQLRRAVVDAVHARRGRPRRRAARAPPSRCACARCARRRVRRTGRSGRAGARAARRLRLRVAGRRQLLAGGQEVRDLAEDPRPALRGAADHDRVGAGARAARRAPCAASRCRRWPPPECAAPPSPRRSVSYSASPLVALLARAAVHGDHRDAGALGGARDGAPRCARASHQPVRIFSVTGTPRGAQAATTASMIAQRQRLVLHQRRAGPLVAHLLGRAAHVDVDDLRAAVDVVGARPRPSSARRCRRSAPRSAPLSPSWSARREVFRLFHSSLARGHHLAHRVARAEPLAQLAERPVGHAGHRGDEQAVRQRDGADVHGRAGEAELLKKEAAV